MGSMSIVHWMVVVGIVVLLFGRGKISGLMGDVADGIKSFKKGMQEDEPATASAAETKLDQAAPADPSVHPMLSQHSADAKSIHREAV